MAVRRKRVLLNAMHATTGGGLTYLRGILPELAKDERFTWTLLAPQAALAGWELPEGVTVKVAPELNFWKGHLWEQLWLPVLATKWGMQAVLCNANYVPLMASKPMPIIHTTPRAAGQAQTRGMKLYWKVLKLLTTLSVWNAPVAFSVAKHVIPDYVGPWMAKKVRVASPAIGHEEVGGDAVKDPNLVVTVGDFYAQKDYPLLVQALKVLREKRPASRLMIIGRPVDARVRNEVLALIRELKLADAVTLTGGMPHDKLMQALARASVYVSTSKAECFNIPVLEAMASGVPCVLGDTPFQREVAGETAVYVPVDKGGEIAAAFAVAMFGLLENQSLAGTLRAAGLKRAANYTWVATARVIADGVAAAFGMRS